MKGLIIAFVVLYILHRLKQIEAQNKMMYVTRAEFYKLKTSVGDLNDEFSTREFA